MKEASKDYIYQYRLAFYLSWAMLYFIFPSWHTTQIYISFTNEIIDLPVSIKKCLLIYFFLSAYLLDFSFKHLFIDTPLINYSGNPVEPVKHHSGLVLVCCVAFVLHLFTISPMHIISPHTFTDRVALWIYTFTTDHWSGHFNFPVQYMIWFSIILLALIVKQKKLIDFISSKYNAFSSLYRSNLFVKLLFIAWLVSIFFVYTKLLPDHSRQDHLIITAEAPLGTLLYLIPYYLFGIELPYFGPAIIQFSFYILSSIFLYKTILLFSEKETALLGASIYLFSPIVYDYATLSHLASGMIFFIIMISYFFLKFIKDGNNHDLLLTAYFTSIGSLYKRETILMFMICSAYLIFLKIRKKDLRLITSLKILSLAPLTFLPWYFIGTRGADNSVFSHFTEIKSLFSYASMLLSQISWPVFSLFLVSIIYAFIYKRNKLTVFFGIVLVAYYCLYTSLKQQEVHRYAMALYPGIAVFLAQFIYSLAKNVRWKYAYTVVYLILIIYMAMLCIVPRSSTNLITYKYRDFENQNFPDDKAAEWVLKNTRDDENVLILNREANIYTLNNIYSLEIIQELFEAGDRIHYLNIPKLSDMLPSNDLRTFRENLMQRCKKDNISYIMFPGGNAITLYPLKKFKQLEIRHFLEEDKYDDFILAAKFNIDDNYIYIYKLRENSIKTQ